MFLRQCKLNNDGLKKYTRRESNYEIKILLGNKIRGTIDGKKPQECYLQTMFLEYIIKALIDHEYSFEWELKKITLPSVDADVFKLVYKGE